MHYPFFLTSISNGLVFTTVTRVFSSIAELSKLRPSKICSPNLTLPAGFRAVSVIPVVPGTICNVSPVLLMDFFPTFPEVAVSVKRPKNLLFGST